MRGTLCGGASKSEMTSSLDDTIVALSTPLGTGAIAVIRLTGRRALDISGEVFVRQGKAFPSREESHRLIYGHIVDPSVGSTLDEVLVAAMYAPVSYTREDMVEVHCHGGQAAVRSILRLFIERGAGPPSRANSQRGPSSTAASIWLKQRVWPT